MEVDHSAFVVYGAEVVLHQDVDVDDLDTWLSTTGSDLNLTYVEWGSRCYGGQGGFLVGDKRFVGSGGGLRALKGDNPPSDTTARIRAAIQRGAPFTCACDVRWWFGTHTW